MRFLSWPFTWPLCKPLNINSRIAAQKCWIYLINIGEHYPEAVSRRCSVKKVFLEISQNSQKNTCARVSFSIKLQTEACNFIKRATLAQVFSFEFCEHLFLQNTPGGCFWLLLVILTTIWYFPLIFISLVCPSVTKKQFHNSPFILLSWS